MSTTYSDIAALLESHLNSISPSIPIAWENINYTPTTAAFAQATLLPAEPFPNGLGSAGISYQKGIFQISLFYPAGEGRGNAVNKADAIVSHFARGTTLSQNGLTLIVEQAWRGTAQSDSKWYHLPINIRYYAYQ